MKCVFRRRIVLLAILALASCRHDAPPPARSGPARRIVCANAAAAEFVCRLVAPERIAAIPEQADSYSMLELRAHGFEKVARFPRYVAEAVLALNPDLVVTHDWQNAQTTGVLRSRGVDVLVLKSAQSYEDIRDTLVGLGRRLDCADNATLVVAELDARVAQLRASSSARSTLSAMVYSNDGTGGSTAGARTTADTMIRLAGLKNAAADAGIVEHTAIDFERLITIDPDVLIVAAPAQGEGGSATKNVIESSAALANLKAVKGKRIVVLPAPLMSADSPPLVDGAEILAREVDRMLSK
jgi:iron complex transport system substrate-binding protein